jgi:murein DD-endopeptidase MepM/ murein hydrolase activator NlpD
MIMPIDGQVTSEFGMRMDPISNENAQHNGIDIAGEIGTPIKAAMDGIVVKVEESKTMGRSIRLSHGNGLETVYGHCSEILMDENQAVKQGDFIAKVGDTGLVTSAHLHFEVIKDGMQIDPMSIVESVKQPK